MISKFNNKNNNPHKKIAFTLAEMLITIAIVGILAAITIPNLYHSYRGAVIKAQLKKVDSDIHKLEQKMRADGLFPPSGTNTLRKILPNYLETPAACGSPKLSTYRSLYTSTLGYPNNIAPDGIYCFNGRVLMAKNPSFISIDINGYEKGPNRFGVDVYVWQIFNNGIKPTGAPGTSCLHGGGVDYPGCCVPTNYRTYNGHDAIINGFTCTYKALNDPSYFKKIKYLK